MVGDWGDETGMSPPYVYWLIYMFPVAVLIGIAVGGAWTFLAAGLAFVVILATDFMVGSDQCNPDEHQEQYRLQDTRFHWPLLFWGPLQLFSDHVHFLRHQNHVQPEALF